MCPVAPPSRKKTTKEQRDRIQKRSEDRRRQRAAKAKGEAVTSDEARRRRTLAEKVTLYRSPARKGECIPPPDLLSLGKALGFLFAPLMRERTRLVLLLAARLRQMSPR
jgi:hypothetical protein